LGNAIKFTHHGGVVIKCHVIDDSKDYIRLKFEVIDSGIGIRPEQQRQLFEPFSQVDGSTTRLYGGTGLGLSICLQLVQLMMGEIAVQSEPNIGSNFWFTVVANREQRALDNSSIKTAGIRMSFKQQSILLATESELNAKMICSLLNDFPMTHTTDMFQAVPKALQEHHPVLILDIAPKPSTSMVHQLQSVDDDPECELHIILLYTPSTEGHKLAAEATNAASDRRGRLVKMAKPVRRKKLLHMLEQVLDQQQHVSSHIPLGNRMIDHFAQSELDWFAKKPVLIAEDNMVAQKLLRKQLEKMGFIVESANNGEEAVQLYTDRPMNYYCMGFFDHHMPKVKTHLLKKNAKRL
jgi:CheY-like chemotaxis protein